MKRDVDYVVNDGEIIIVDEFTGRLMYGRRYSNGLHQAIEAKEGLYCTHANQRRWRRSRCRIISACINKLAGMTGTAKTEEEEFRDIYNMDVVVIPTNKADQAPMIWRTVSIATEHGEIQGDRRRNRGTSTLQDGRCWWVRYRIEKSEATQRTMLEKEGQ